MKLATIRTADGTAAVRLDGARAVETGASGRREQASRRLELRTVLGREGRSCQCQSQGEESDSVHRDG